MKKMKMDTDMRFNKFFIGILVIGIILIGGQRGWSEQSIQESRGICGPGGMELNHSVLYCDKSCKTDNDCKFTCGCGAINKNEICHDEGFIYACLIDYGKVKCKEDRCIVEKELLGEEVTITTDKIEYEQGEMVGITIMNNLDSPIIPQAILPYKTKSIKFLGENYGIGLIEKFEEGTWIRIEPIWRCGNSCFSECSYKHLFEPGEKRVFEWNQTILICDKVNRTEKVEIAGTGRYRIGSAVWLDQNAEIYEAIYSNEFTIKEKQRE